MPRHETHRSSAEQHGTVALRATLLAAMLGALGYVIISIVAHSAPWLNAAAHFALESRMTSPDAEAATAPEASLATAAPLPEESRNLPIYSNSE